MKQENKINITIINAIPPFLVDDKYSAGSFPVDSDIFHSISESLRSLQIDSINADWKLENYKIKLDLKVLFDRAIKSALNGTPILILGDANHQLNSENRDYYSALLSLRSSLIAAKCPTALAVHCGDFYYGRGSALPNLITIFQHTDIVWLHNSGFEDILNLFNAQDVIKKIYYTHSLPTVLSEFPEHKPIDISYIGSSNKEMRVRLAGEIIKTLPQFSCLYATYGRSSMVDHDLRKYSKFAKTLSLSRVTISSPYCRRVFLNHQSDHRRNFVTAAMIPGRISEAIANFCLPLHCVESGFNLMDTDLELPLTLERKDFLPFIKIDESQVGNQSYLLDNISTAVSITKSSDFREMIIAYHNRNLSPGRIMLPLIYRALELLD